MSSKFFFVDKYSLLCYNINQKEAKHREDKNLCANRLRYCVLQGTSCEIKKYDGTDTAVVIPQLLGGYTVKRIGPLAFYERADLTEVVIPDSVTEIDYEAFRDCKSLHMRLGSGVKKIKSGAFIGVRYIEVAEENPHFSAVDGNLYSKDGTTLLQYTAKETESLFAVPDGVTTIGIAAFAGCKELLEIRFPETLKTIQWSAFEGCTGLKSLSFPDGTEYLDGGAFTDCSALTEVSVGVGLKAIGEMAFEGCSSMKRLRYNGTSADWRAVSLAEDWADGARSMRIETKDNTALTEDGTPSSFLDYTVNQNGKTCTVSGIGLCADKKLCFPTEIDGYPVTEIGTSESLDNDFSGNLFVEGSFERRGDIESVFIPDGVGVIGDHAFKNCTALKSVWISGSVKKIGTSAFEGCVALESVFLADGVEQIGEKAFFGCTLLKEIVLPDSVSAVYTGALAGGVAKIAISEKNPFFVTVDGNLYSKDGKTLLQYAAGKRDSAFTCPKSVTEIRSSAFYGCHALTDVVLGENVAHIGEEAFCGCKNLSFIHIPDSVTEIGVGAFSGCVSLSRPYFGNGLREIGAYAFEHCTALRQSPLCKGVTEIRRGTFDRCTSLRKIFVPDTVVRIANFAFNGCTALREVSLPEALESISEGAFHGCDSLKTVSFRGTVKQWKALMKKESLHNIRAVMCVDGDVEG